MKNTRHESGVIKFFLNYFVDISWRAYKSLMRWWNCQKQKANPHVIVFFNVFYCNKYHIVIFI